MAQLRDDPFPDTFIGGEFFGPADIPPPAPGFESPGPAEEGGERAGAGRAFPLRSAAGTWRRGRFPAAFAVFTAVLLVFHTSVPNSPGNMGSLLESVLPWTGVMVPLTLLAALVRRSAVALTAAVVLACVWAAMFGKLFTGSAPGGTPDLTVVTHNVNAGNPDPAATARDLLAARPDVLALEEVTGDSLPSYQRVLDPALTHSVHIGTVALWSRYPLISSERVTIDPGWSRSLRAEIRGPDGPFTVYVVHLASVRVGPDGFTAGRRDEMITALDRELDGEPEQKVVLMGDLNGASGDRSLAPLVARLSPVQDVAGSGFGFSWPARFPFARVDHILTRGLTPTDAWTLPATGSDHRPVAARLTE